MMMHAYLGQAAQRLQAVAIAEAALEAEIILMHVLCIDRTRLFLDDYPLNSAQIDQLDMIMARRLTHEPLAYIIGEKEFWSRPFFVNADVLIPRPETEILIELVLQQYGGKSNGLEILDLGVGSGVIAVTLALELINAQVYGIDISPAALMVARRNVSRHGASKDVNLICSDWLKALQAKRKFDLIVSNPPYVAVAIKDELQPELAFEPQHALYSGADGMDSIRILAGKISRYLRSGGWLYMEIGAEQADNVLDIFTSLHDYDQLAVHKDYAGRPRVLQARRL